MYPGEVLKENVTALKIVMANSALRLRAILDIEDKDEKRVAGDEWLFEGPGNCGIEFMNKIVHSSEVSKTIES